MVGIELDKNSFTFPCCTTAACTSLSTKVLQAEYVLSTALSNRDWDCIQQIIRELNMGDFFDRLEAANLPTEMTNWPKKESAMSAKLDEHHIYGSARLGVDNREQTMYRRVITQHYNPWIESWTLAPQYIYQMPPLDLQNHTYTRGNKRYELSNHLGNVLAVITDKKVIIGSNGDIDAYYPDVSASQDYYAFGSIRSDRRYKRLENNGKDKLTIRIRLHSVDVNAELELIFPGQQPTPGNGLVYDLNIYSSIEAYIDDIVLGMQGDPGLHAYRDGRDLVMELDPTQIPIQPYCDYPVYVAVNAGTASVQTIKAFQCGDGYRYMFNGKEHDPEIYGEGNAYDFGARMYDARIGRWFSVDPQKEKYVGYAPYHFGYNNPIIVIDPNGEENIVVIGNQNDRSRNYTAPNSDMGPNGYRYGDNRRHFLEAGLNEALRMKANSPSTEPTTMIVFQGDYSESELKHYQNQAAQHGINFVVVAKVKEIISYVNYKDTKGYDDPLDVSEAFTNSGRYQDKITDFTYIGHGGTEGLLPAYHTYSSNNVLSIELFNQAAFENGVKILLNACNSARGPVNAMNEKLSGLSSYTIIGFEIKTYWGKDVSGKEGLGVYTLAFPQKPLIFVTPEQFQENTKIIEK